MSRQFRYRMAALVASGLIFGVPLLTNGTANADQLEPGARRVTFDGGMLGLSCGSKPSVERLRVPAESTLHVVNRTGHNARLELAGAPRGVIPENGAAEVVFRRGTTPVVLDPDCAGSDDPVPMLVTAVPSTPSALPDPAPGGSNAGTLPAIVAGSAGQSVAGSALPDDDATGSRPPHQVAGPRGVRDPDRRRTAKVHAAGETPRQDTDQKVKNDGSRTSVAGGPTFAGMPPGERKTVLPADRAAVVTASPAGTAPAAESPAAAEPPILTEPAAEPVAAIRPMRTTHPIGLLGLTAIVCVLGVLTAAIRAIVSQRASRSNLA
ncbi:Myosin light chain kinase 2, skeletal/cardiac muscle [Actinoplanes sp. SE50]|uniref:hypothetical protein n=1 Tax=unclassified Actinoplanes TaxID=2626549 RepID=UPI00023EDDDD|nr:MULTISPECIES: hypothetical protein [unclassified Actinoplanes]AEV89222.1 Myosin light chain kinase 2, skeletal/cardiac muscle [Actinoplanes sp. SE50/110]ATO87628.1 Myosin light chain kinase 2, skeletal/cardiac muscle [Actinoplanes sp. SE50]SLM05047.1 Myosin light chain kinase 2, skeletal/cardiac muscle [Actinoplanes sp. SE50/110]